MGLTPDRTRCKLRCSIWDIAMKTVEGWVGRQVILSNRTYEITGILSRGYVMAQDLVSGKAEKINLQRAIPVPGSEFSVPCGVAFVAHVAQCYGPGPYQGTTYHGISRFIRENPLCSCKWESYGVLQVAETAGRIT